MIDKSSLSPDRVALDLVLTYRAKLELGSFIAPSSDRLMLLAMNHRGQKVQASIEVHTDGKPDDGPPARFVIFKLGATVWKVSPSVTVPGMLHGYLTLVGVPEPAPWENVRCCYCGELVIGGASGPCAKNPHSDFHIAPARQ